MIERKPLSLLENVLCTLNVIPFSFGDLSPWCPNGHWLKGRYKEITETERDYEWQFYGTCPVCGGDYPISPVRHAEKISWRYNLY